MKVSSKSEIQKMEFWRKVKFLTSHSLDFSPLLLHQVTLLAGLSRERGLAEQCLPSESFDFFPPENFPPGRSGRGGPFYLLGIFDLRPTISCPSYGSDCLKLK